MRRALYIATAVAALAGLGLTVWTGVAAGGVGQARGDAGEVARRLDTLFGAAAGAARMRAEGLAVVPSVRAAVATDAATVRDMARVEGFVFTPAEGETIELFQLSGQARPLSLYRMPARQEPLTLPERGVARLDMDADGGFVITVGAPVTSLYAGGRAGGAVAVAARVDHAAVESALAAGGGVARVRWASSPRESSGTVTAPIALPPPLVAAAPLEVHIAVGAVNAPARVVGPVLLVAALVLGLVLLLDGRRRRAEDAVTAPVAVAAPIAVAAPVVVVRDHEAWSGAMPTPITRLEPQVDSVPVGIDARAEKLATRYRLLRPLGRGHGAEVYLAQSFVRGTPSTVALKLLDDMPDGARHHFLDAARRQALIDHPHVATVYDVGDGEVAYVAIEYVEGCTVQTLLDDLAARREPLPLVELVAIIAAVCSALEAAQQARGVDGKHRPLVHGALKPSNVLACRRNAIKVSDFGAPPSPTDRHAPEQYAGAPADRSTDVHAVGVLLHELLTGRAVTALPDDPRRWPPLPAPSSLRPGLPRAIDAVVAKATRFAARGRYATAAALASDLARAAHDAGRAGGGPHLGDFVDRARRSS